jgi:ADP-ribose pyrophosphatase YjhB (NUDIX family)
MAKLPEVRKVTVLLFRRRSPDEILIVRKPGRNEWILPWTVQENGEHADAAARRLATELTRGAPIATTSLAVSNAFVVKNGPSAGDWTETFVAVELGSDARGAPDAQWLPHFEAKAQLITPKAREAITELRARVKLLP